MTLVDDLNARNESLYPDLDGLAEWGVRRPMDIDLCGVPANCEPRLTAAIVKAFDLTTDNL